MKKTICILSVLALLAVCSWQGDVWGGRFGGGGGAGHGGGGGGFHAGGGGMAARPAGGGMAARPGGGGGGFHPSAPMSRPQQPAFHPQSGAAGHQFSSVHGPYG